MSEKLQQAIVAIKAGDKATGQRLLTEILKTDPRNENAWLWMSTTLETDECKKQCLNNVLKINPDNQLALRGLAQLQQSTSEPVVSEPLVIPPSFLNSKLKERLDAENVALYNPPQLTSLSALISPKSQKNVQVIGIGRRFVAFFIDYLILSLVTILVFQVSYNLFFNLIYSPISDTSQTDEYSSVLVTVFLIAHFFIQFIIPLFIIGGYFVSFWAIKGQTIGQMVLDIKVISTDGSPVTVGKAILRFIGYIAGFVVIWLGFIWAGFDGKRQGWHDKTAGTYVVRKDTQFSTNTITVVPSDSTIAAAIIVFLFVSIHVLFVIILMNVHVSL